MSDHDGFSWTGFFVHFVFGAVLGGLLGTGIWAWALDGQSAIAGLLCIGGGALFLGLSAGFLGDRFWESFRDIGWGRFWP